MKFVTSILLTALVAYALGLQLPWYTIAAAAFVVGLAIPQKAGRTFLSGTLGIALLWAALIGFNLFNGAALIAKQMASIIPLKGNVFLLATITCFIGGLLGGFGALTGHFTRKLFK